MDLSNVNIFSEWRMGRAMHDFVEDTCVVDYVFLILHSDGIDLFFCPELEVFVYTKTCNGSSVV